MEAFSVTFEALTWESPPFSIVGGPEPVIVPAG